MRVSLHDISKGRGGQALPTTSLEFHTRPGKVNTFTPRQKDIINGYLTRIG